MLMNFIIILTLLLSILALISVQYSELDAKKKEIVKFTRTSQIEIKPSPKSIIINFTNSGKDKTRDNRSEEMGKIASINSSSIVSGTDIGILMTSNLLAYHRSTSLSRENIEGNYVEEVRIKT